MRTLAAAPEYALFIFIAIVVSLELGRWLGKRQLRIDPDGARTGIGAIEGAVFGLLALLIAFTFSGAASRMDVRRDLIVHETNAIGTAWLRLDLLAANDQALIRPLFRQYVDARLAYYRDLRNDEVATQEHQRAMTAQQAIWTASVNAVKNLPNPAPGLQTLAALNDMIDITTTRAVALKTHPPILIYLMLLALTWISALLIGFGMAGAIRRNWLHSLGYALVMVSVLYVILDFEYPRRGIIRVDAFDQILEQQRDVME